MARVGAVVSDLLFASKVTETLAAAGHEVALVAAVGDPALEDASILIVDLAEVDPATAVAAGKPVLGFYPHTDAAVRDRAHAAGVDVAVPRSRFVREMPALVEGLLRS